MQVVSSFLFGTIGSSIPGQLGYAHGVQFCDAC